ncbi:SDR family NAD(P)-dependent oxidoreductase [Peribacillus butanolivorans]|uniref:SDR family NAD(P)-dependent oxidoreductase n=1 Tax=Peribacillus butanolivorans TaxID=421767 RepID=UPI0035E02A24
MEETLQLVDKLADQDLDYLHISVGGFWNGSIRDDNNQTSRVVMIHERVPPIERIGSKVNLGLKDKTALVTGGSRGIGKAIAIAFAKEGTNVVICGCGKEALKEAAAENEQLGGNRF